MKRSHGTSIEYVYRVKSVERVTDGDTFWLHVDVGFRGSLLVHCRLNGFDTPEIYSGSDYEKAEGKHAKEFVTDWFENRLNHGRVFIQTEKDPDSFGRWLTDVWTEFDGGVQYLGNALMDLDLATTWPIRWREEYDNGSQPNSSGSA